MFSLLPGSKYELMATAFGGQGVAVDTPDELRTSLSKALQDDQMWVINCRIDPSATKKAQTFGWLTRREEMSEPKL